MHVGKKIVPFLFIDLRTMEEDVLCQIRTAPTSGSEGIDAKVTGKPKVTFLRNLNRGKTRRVFYAPQAQENGAKGGSQRGDRKRIPPLKRLFEFAC